MKSKLRHGLSLADVFVLVTALLAGLAVRMQGITKSSIWHDEGYTMMLAPQHPLQIIARTARDVHPPLHYLTLHYWMRLFGQSEAAARGLSVAFSLATIFVAYLLLRRLFGAYTARFAALLLAGAPFLVRYAQEARMYSMVAFLLTLATYYLVKAQQDGWTPNWYIYAGLMAAAFYTHYFAVFMVAVHWLYVLLSTPKYSRRHQVITQGLWQRHWWLANASIVLLFLPWVPSAYAQFTRVQSAFWIPPVNHLTLPKTVSQFLTYTANLRWLDPQWSLAAAALLALLTVLALILNRPRWRNLVLIALMATLAPAAVFMLSAQRPIYIDRYFVFAAVGFYCLLAAIITNQPWHKVKFLPELSLAGLLVLFGYGILSVHEQSNHQMRIVASQVNQQYQPGDGLVAGELYVYFDFSYYNRTGTTLQLLAPGGVTGFGESSLLYDRSAEIVLKELRQMRPDSGFVWVIGKTGPHDYFDKVPGNWKPVGPKIEAGYSAAQKYQVGSARTLAAYLVE